MEKVTTGAFIYNSLWRFIDIISHKLISLVISIVLARLICPEAFGVIALTTVFIAFTDIFILNGFNVAIIRKDSADELDYSTVTTMSLLFTTLMYVCFYVSAPFVSKLYDSEELCPVLRSITILLFFQSIASVIRAKATRELQFKRMAFSAFISNVSSGVIAVVLAYAGLGVWALVVQQLFANFLEMLILVTIFKWRISVRFSFARAKQMFKFTMGVLGASFLDFFGNNFCSLVIGKSFSTKDLGYYSRGNMFPETIGLNIYSAITSVLLPTLASYQDDKDAMKHITRRVMSLTIFVIFPLMFGLMGISNVMIPLLLTDKWLPCIPLLWFCCIFYAVNPIRAIGYSVFYAKGLSNFSVKIEILRATSMIIGLFIVIVLLHGSLVNVLLVNAIISVFIALTTHYFVKKCIRYSYSELLGDIIPSLILSLMMMAVVLTVGYLPVNPICMLIIQIFTGGLFYLGAALILRNKNIEIIKTHLCPYFEKYFV